MVSKYMYKLVIASLFLVIASYSTASSSDMTKNVIQALKAWQPTEVHYLDNNLIVVLPQKRITIEIYGNSITWLCAMSKVNRVDLSGVNQIGILNMFFSQGFVFEGGKKQCEKINSAPSNQADILLLDNTYTFKNFQEPES